MQYVEYGKTGCKVSRLGMGCMRLPVLKDASSNGGTTIWNEDESIRMIHRAIDLGVNYFDTAPYYCDKQSEVILGKALKGKRSSVFLSTKNPIENDSADDYEKRLESSLKQLDTDYIDFYHFWGISLDCWKNSINKKDGILSRAQKLKEQGLIRHISFSFHDQGAGKNEVQNLLEILQQGQGVLESMLVQYNLLDQGKAAGIAKAHEMGLGVAVMGPVGGGRLGAPSEVIKKMLGEGKVQSSAEVALRFVLSNSGINIALSGVSTMEQLEENAKIAGNENALSPEEKEQIISMQAENERLAGLYCTGCNYCMPCPKGINIPEIFKIMNYHRVYKITEFAKKEYSSIDKVPWMKYNNAAACVKCGECEKKCPQSLKIREQLYETHRTLTA